MSEIFSMSGRFSRSKYVWMTVIITGVTYALALVMGVLMGLMGLGEDMAGVAGGVLGMCGQIVLAFVMVKRLHDLDRPGWHFWLLLVPIYNLYLGLVMLFTKGTTGTNQYGPDPVTS